MQKEVAKRMCQGSLAHGRLKSTKNTWVGTIREQIIEQRHGSHDVLHDRVEEAGVAQVLQATAARQRSTALLQHLADLERREQRNGHLLGRCLARRLKERKLLVARHLTVLEFVGPSTRVFLGASPRPWR